MIEQYLAHHRWYGVKPHMLKELIATERRKGNHLTVQGLIELLSFTEKYEKEALELEGLGKSWRAMEFREHCALEQYKYLADHFKPRKKTEYALRT